MKISNLMHLPEHKHFFSFPRNGSSCDIILFVRGKKKVFCEATFPFIQLALKRSSFVEMMLLFPFLPPSFFLLTKTHNGFDGLFEMNSISARCLAEANRMWFNGCDEYAIKKTRKMQKISCSEVVAVRGSWKVLTWEADGKLRNNRSNDEL